LLDQSHQVEHQTQIKKQAVPTPQTDDAPGLAPHHPIISEDSSVSDNDDNPDDRGCIDKKLRKNSPILKFEVWKL
jgi:hypothetical protein